MQSASYNLIYNSMKLIKKIKALVVVIAVFFAESETAQEIAAAFKVENYHRNLQFGLGRNKML